ncbi:peptidase inhibitor family I36 protein [Micromonospora sp. WMMD998]|uniref:peptidase inhibitor family I36 protein n=1 Tax=Micromonospora sp. WMMD998 TaxID=3016092 RepID=UPI00249B92E8|nr:peptidase inhibitor family I36 protein [Micromonospora sp. WMMD998]WFE41114.1 peptidase inhibitor family I36 protein [Micromonospora sp. WMMD998]
MNIQLKRLVAVAGALAATTAVSLTATAAPASADACPSTKLCAYLSTNYGGVPGTVAGNNTNLLQYSKFDNAASVFNNGASCGVTIWNGTGYSGTSVYLPRGTGYSNLASQNPPFYLNVASNIWC